MQSKDRYQINFTKLVIFIKIFIFLGQSSIQYLFFWSITEIMDF